MNKLKIREAKFSDVEEIVSLRQTISLETYCSFDKREVENWVKKRHGMKKIMSEFKGEDESLMLVCYIDNILVATGYCKIYANKYNCDAYMGGLYILPEWRKVGLGSKLIKRRIEWLKHKKIKRVITEAEILNKPALKLLQKHGFIEREIAPFDRHVKGMNWSVQTLDL